MRRLRTPTNKLRHFLGAMLLFASVFTTVTVPPTPAPTGWLPGAATADGLASSHLFGAVVRAASRVPEPMRERVKSVFTDLSAVIAAEYPEVSSYTIHVVVEKTPNAWINRNNEIYVTSGLLELLPTDDQLAGVIGHEIAHGTAGHIPHRVSQSLWSAFAVVALGTWAGTQGSADWGGLLHMRDLFMYAFSREQESEADVLGMRYARAAGYAPEGLVEALRLMEGDRRRLPTDSIWHELYRTHPPISQRIADLRFVLATERLDSAPLRGTMSPISAGARSPEEAAQGFAQALLAGDERAIRPFVLPGSAERFMAVALGGDVSDDVTDAYGAGPDGLLAEHIDPAWAKAELEVVFRQQHDIDFAAAAPALTVPGSDPFFSTMFVVRLWRSVAPAEAPAPTAVGPDGTEISSPSLLLTLQRSARGWVVTSWDVVEESWLEDLPGADFRQLPPGRGGAPLR